MLDFDEVLLTVKDDQVRKYVEEAVSSYRIRNYRSAMIAIWIAAMFDLVKKFQILVDQREPEAIKKWKELKPKVEEHRNWEMELIEAAGAVSMLSRYEVDTLKGLSKSRNRYAHPSFDDVGTLFDPTPEEVRYFVRTLYDHVLSQPAQLGAFYVNELLDKLKRPSFFSPDLSLEELSLERESVLNTISRINRRQVPRLLKELFNALAAPESKEHGLNIICFIVNVWGAYPNLELDEKFVEYWNQYFENQPLHIRLVCPLLNYPDKINSLSQRVQNFIVDLVQKELILGRTRYSKSLSKLFSHAEMVKLAKLLRDKAPEIIPIERVFEKFHYYMEVFGEDFSSLFGPIVLEEVRSALSTRDGYTVNPKLSVLRQCGMWDIADSLSLPERQLFAKELVASLNSNNFETMFLLSFENKNKIPWEWADLLLKAWNEELETCIWRQKSLLNYYLKHYIAIVEAYKKGSNCSAPMNVFLKVLINQVEEGKTTIEGIKNSIQHDELSSQAWIYIMEDVKDLVNSTVLEPILEI